VRNGRVRLHFNEIPNCVSPFCTYLSMKGGCGGHRLGMSEARRDVNICFASLQSN
jgi:hypothetical protein